MIYILRYKTNGKYGLPIWRILTFDILDEALRSYDFFTNNTVYTEITLCSYDLKEQIFPKEEVKA